MNNGKFVFGNIFVLEISSINNVGNNKKKLDISGSEKTLKRANSPYFKVNT